MQYEPAAVRLLVQMMDPDFVCTVSANPQVVVGLIAFRSQPHSSPISSLAENPSL